jgi:circadian clock protein KaiC
MFIFDESLQTLLTRAGGLGIPLQKHVDAGKITIQQINPAELSPGEFTHIICQAVEERKAAVVVIDSLNGYLHSMPEERYLILQLHELLYYLGQSGVATVVIAAHQGMVGSNMSAPVDATYLADTVILMRYFELDGEIRQAISVMKKRGGPHEKAIREFSMSKGRIHIGSALRGFRGVLTGVPFIEQKSPGQQTGSGT